MKQLMSRASGAVLPGVLVVSLCFPLASHAATCESLARLTLDNTRITIAQEVAPGTFTPPGAARQGGAPPQVPRVYASLPAFCRVAATLTPSSDSDIKIEVWLPTRGWNGKFQAVGNGGWAAPSRIRRSPARRRRLRDGQHRHRARRQSGGVCARTSREGHRLRAIGRARDDGQGEGRSSTPSTARAHALDLEWLLAGRTAGLTEAVRYPADFDGIVAGAPAVNWMHLHAGRMAINRAVNATPASVIPPSKYPTIHRAAIAACDARDGVADSVIENPARCTFDPKVLSVLGAEDNACLTPAQVESRAEDVRGCGTSGHAVECAARSCARIRAGLERASAAPSRSCTPPMPTST